MTELFNKAIEKAHSLPTAMQDAIARIVLSYASGESSVAAPMPERISRPARAVDPDKIDAIARRNASRPLLDHRPAQEILAEAWGELA